MERVDFLPLGSVCRVKGIDGRMMVIARGEQVGFPDGPRYFDYGGCLWPEGLVGDRMAYFNREGIVEVVRRGFSDEEDREYVKKTNDAIAQIDLPRGNPPEDVQDAEQSDGTGRSAVDVNQEV
ncbi:DUF4176 domain-containing protein [Bifidobacterium sp. ESL0784]|uniref:DUF4176 domain-containing protein n=1 Tax=Bifidobacterium sp. ESL0784 TaxID=2983231 RepID=UPI0023F682A6|nr:DUF4176 domain-containing protein [Bifidobacterium sp. ESL0784]MDF7641251.1 DUF4176 domain-containing protein [Bifidobacterium sp. ESL0784]